MGQYVYIGIGSNLNDPVMQVRQALRCLQTLVNSQLIKSSSLYQSAPMAAMEQPDYINAVVLLKTELSAIELLDHLQDIEQTQGRMRDEERWGARIIDLDILLLGDEEINSERLTVPHYGLHERSFVLLPLNEIAPDLDIPGRGLLKEMLKYCDCSDIKKVS
ncbi:MAG: 2-amino-4-hydroxy-6-hydroxymethyldihydropteridine diphosphokinase [Gammaproteobacteria bacterium]|nr:2-amino-4-hydroxy-6-hydroxymethyldihydropteridine diphosphokinase [Gammaproteobacteria bacterium]